MKQIPRREVLGNLVTLASASVLGAGGLLGCDTGAPEARSATRTTQPLPARRVPRQFRSMPTAEGRGAIVHRIFPVPGFRHLDPFVVLDDFEVAQPAGFPDHPHRGFEAFTYMIEGAFHHKDNLGNDSIITAGGTQRFTSGSGARHSEMPGAGTNNRGLQLWVNLPRIKKQIDPSYAGTPHQELPLIKTAGKTTRRIVGEGSPVKLETAVFYEDVSLDAGSTHSVSLPEDNNHLLYLISGEVQAQGVKLAMREGILPLSGQLDISARRPSRFVVLSGRPHREPIYLRGPFVD
ncbi:MAG: pirin family protein [Polyangiaceae bacterium]